VLQSIAYIPYTHMVMTRRLSYCLPSAMLIGMTSISPQMDATTPTQRGYWMAWVATVCFFAGFYALLTPLPYYLAAVGLPDWQIGLVLGAFGVASLLGRPLAGLATDRWGARPVMLAGAAALLIGALAVPATGNVVILFGLRLLQATGYVAFTTAGTGLVVSLSVPGERGRRLAIFGAAANVAITLTPAAISGLLAIAPLATGFLVSGGLALLAGGLAWRLPAGRAAARAQPGLAFPRRLWAPMAAAGLLGVGFAAFFQFTPLLAARRDTIDAGWLYTVYGIGLIASRFGGGGLVDRWGTVRMLLLTCLLQTLGLALFAVATTTGWLIAATLLLAASGLFHPTLLAHHAALLPAAPGRASAAFYVGFDLGIGLGSWLLGFALEIAGLTGLYALAALFALAVLPLLPVIGRPAAL
jgi:predicted MFS family arabinose efflux permease